MSFNSDRLLYLFDKKRDMYYIGDLHELTEREDEKGNRIPFNIKFVKRSTGEIVTANNVKCTSSFFEGHTRNIQFINSGETRKIHTSLIIEFNEQEVYL